MSYVITGLFWFTLMLSCFNHPHHLLHQPKIFCSFFMYCWHQWVKTIENL